MTLTSKNAELVLEKLDVDLLFFNLLLGHNLDGKLLVRSLVGTKSHETEGTLTKNFSELIALFNALHEFEFLVIVDAKCLFARGLSLFTCICHEVFSNFTHVVVGLEGMPKTLILQTLCGIVVPRLYADLVKATSHCVGLLIHRAFCFGKLVLELAYLALGIWSVDLNFD